MLLIKFAMFFTILTHYHSICISAADNKRKKSKQGHLYNCGKNRKVTELFTYKSDSDGKEKQIFISKATIGTGGFSLVFSGFIGESTPLNKLENLPTKRCVAIKLTKRRENDAKCKKAIELQRRSNCVIGKIRQAILGKRTRNNLMLCDFIVRTFDTGTIREDKLPFKFPTADNGGNTKEDNQQKNISAAQLGVTIMELGEETLHSRMYGNPTEFNGEFGHKLIAEQIGQFVKPLLGLHRVAMHLDIKPSNFVFVHSDEKGHDDLLKLIDFDGAEMLATKGQNYSICQQNLCKRPNYLLGTSTYASPEYFTTCLMSTKSDVWALGMIIYELLLIQPHLRLYVNGVRDQHTPSIDSILKKFNTIYRGFTYDKKTKQVENASNNLNWLDLYSSELMMMFNIWNEQPRIAMLLTNMLTYESTLRPSTSAIVDFLEGQCHLLMNFDSNNRAIVLFKDISAAKMDKLLRERIAELDTNENFWLKCLEALPEAIAQEEQYYRDLLANFEKAMRAMKAEIVAMDGKRLCGQSTITYNNNNDNMTNNNNGMMYRR